MAAPMSDLTGYRSDGGGLGQDQGLSKNLRSILTAKLPLLSSPGTVLENSLYYDINSSSITAVEQQATFNKDRIVLNNFAFGSSPSAYIPSVLFAGTVFWIAELNDKATWPATPTADGAKLQFPEGWGFAALDQIVVYMGASTIAQIQISGMTNFLVNAATCETQNKRQNMLRGAGYYLCPPDTNSIMALPTANSPLWTVKSSGNFYVVDSVKPVYSPMRQCIVPLRLPWSSMAVIDKRLSLDTKLSTQPIQITLYTNPVEDYAYLGTQAATAIGNSFSSSTIQLWQEELSDKSLSVRNELLAMPEFNVGYPFQYAQSIPFDIIAASDDGKTTHEFLMNITSIINSDLSTFLFNITWAGRTNPQNGQLCPLYGELLQDITLLLNGQRFFAFNEASYEFVTLAKHLDVPYTKVALPMTNIKSAASGLQSFPANGNAVWGNSNIYEFNNSRLRAIVAEANMQNTARFTNQTFQLSFKINRDLLYTASNLTEKTSGYVLNMSYLYNAVFLIGGDGGTTKLITN
jgi:hypothetical protein